MVMVADRWTPKTEWRVTALLSFGILDLRLVVDTTAPVVVEAIEEAARSNGIVLQRLSKEETAA